jgi:hypothetical protein
VLQIWIQCLFYPWIRDPGSWVKIKIRIPELRIFGLKILKFFDVDPESCDPGAGIRESGINILDPQHWKLEHIF